jgi:protocatechuate 3,4-dioxygenase beta subunit
MMAYIQPINKALPLILVVILFVMGLQAFSGKAQAGTIQGTVRDFTSGNPVSGIYVEAFEVNFGYVSTGASQNTTNANGQYSLSVMGTNTIYNVFFRRTNSAITYMGQWYNGASSFAAATPVVIPNGATVSGIDASMKVASGGFISGRVTGPNGAGVSGATIWVYDYNQKVQSKRGLVSAVADTDGYYSINSPVPPGTYKVECYDNAVGSNNQIEWWQGKTGFSTADPFVVTAVGANKADCQLSEGGIITGTVTDGSNNPIMNASIRVYDQTQSYASIDFIGLGYTDATGVYTIKRLPSGNYKVLFTGPYGTDLASQFYANQATFNQANWVPVVASSTTANINAQLFTGGAMSGSTNTGTASAERKTPSVKGEIQTPSLTAGTSATINVYDEYQKLVTTLKSNLDGTFSVTGLPAGKYKVEFVRDDLGSTWFNGRRTYGSADWIPVTAGSTTPDINGQLVPAAVISGKVTDTLGAAISKVTVRVYDDATLEPLNPFGLTDSFGIYTLNSISPGSSRLYYDSHGTGYFPEWWAEKKSITDATPIDLISGQTYPNKDAVLDPSKEIYLPLVLKN